MLLTFSGNDGQLLFLPRVRTWWSRKICLACELLALFLSLSSPPLVLFSLLYLMICKIDDKWIFIGTAFHQVLSKLTCLWQTNPSIARGHRMCAQITLRAQESLDLFWVKRPLVAGEPPMDRFSVCLRPLDSQN